MQHVHLVYTAYFSFFALKRGRTVFVRALKCLPGPISDCRLIDSSVLYYFVGNEGPQYSALSDLRFYPN